MYASFLHSAAQRLSQAEAFIALNIANINIPVDTWQTFALAPQVEGTWRVSFHVMSIVGRHE